MSTKVKMQGTIKTVPLKELFPDRNQPRQDFDTVEMEKLKGSIEDRGIMTPITVEPKKDGSYLIVDGERRYKNATALKMKEVPVNILDRELDSFERNIIRFQLQETHRQWTVFEKAEALASIKRELGLSDRELSRALAISQPTTSRYLSLLQFPIGLRKRFVEAKMPFAHLESLTHMKNIMPQQLIKKYPEFLDLCIDKFDKGVVTHAKDWRMINHLIKGNKIQFVEKFFNELKYTAKNAYGDSGLKDENFGHSIASKARIMLRDLESAQTSDLELNDEALVVLTKLNANLLENYSL